MATFLVIPWVEADGRREFLPLGAMFVSDDSRERVEVSFPYQDGHDRGGESSPSRSSTSRRRSRGERRSVPPIPKRPGVLGGLSDALRARGVDVAAPGASSARPRNDPLWRGPREDGVTFSLLNRFLACRERFRVHVVDGLRPVDDFNHRIEYGNMWHAAEEALGAPGGDLDLALASIDKVARSLKTRYRFRVADVEHWRRVCATQFPVYASYWADHPDVVNRSPVFTERTFDVVYALPSGDEVRLRGKWDMVDLVAAAPVPFAWLQENKTRAEIDEASVRRQLKFDLQTMLYVIALRHWKNKTPAARATTALKAAPIGGVRYNVIRRPLSGGRGSIVKHKPTKANPQGESDDAFYERLRVIITESPDDFFGRWNVPLTDKDLDWFRLQCLDPILQAVVDWWRWIEGSKMVERAGLGSGPFDGFNGVHWRHPFGLFNQVDEWGAGDVDEYLDTGSTVGLERFDNLYPELAG